MTQLLISVRSAVEALEALAGGADWIDVKEPRRGSLGAADVSVMREVIAAVAGQTPVSAALGELLDSETPQFHSFIESLPTGLNFAKFGLAGCARRSDWRTQWQAAIQRLPHSIQPVAVVYADHHAAAARHVLEYFASPAVADVKLRHSMQLV